jgi:hypothetical protein
MHTPRFRKEKQLPNVDMWTNRTHRFHLKKPDHSCWYLDGLGDSIYTRSGSNQIQIDDDVDPLDAFMQDVDQEARRIDEADVAKLRSQEWH